MTAWLRDSKKHIFDFWKLKRLDDFLESHPVAQSFTGDNLVVNGHLLDQGLIRLSSEVSVDAETFGRLFMLPNGSSAQKNIQHQIGSDQAPPGIYFKSAHPWIQSGHNNSVGIYSAITDLKGLFIEGVFIDHIFMDKAKTPDGFGRIAFALLALTAYRLEWSEITLLAGGGAPKHADKWGIPDMVGYFVWPKLGFDAPVDSAEVSNFPWLAHCKTVSEVRAVDEYWWELQEGNGRVMRFDLAPGSKSWKTLLHYILN